MEVNHKDRAHSELGASSSKRWMSCPSSVALSRDIPDKTSAFASEGTCAHEVCDIALNEGKDAREYIGNVYEGVTVTEEMAEHVQLYLDYVRNAAEGKELSVEERIDLSFVDPRMFGSNDAAIYEPYGTLEIIDFKYGKGVEVFPEENPQLMYYALGAAHGGEYMEVKMTIIQPRVDNPIKSWTVPYERIEQFQQELVEAVERVDSGIESFELGDHCKFCKAKAICPAQKNKAMEVAKMDFAEAVPTGPASLPEPNKLSDQELKNVLDHAKLITDWITSVEGYALGQLEAGKKIDGYKLVKGRSYRKIADEQKFIEDTHLFYGDKIFKPRQLETIGKLTKLVGKEELEKHITYTEPKKTIAPESDKREAITPTIVEDFGKYINTSYDDMEF